MCKNSTTLKFRNTCGTSLNSTAYSAVMGRLVVSSLVMFISLLMTVPGITFAQYSAFSAVLTNNIGDPSVDLPITFNVIETSIGGAFDGTTFTAPQQGLYLFTFSGKSYGMTVHLKINDAIHRSAARTEVYHFDAENMESSFSLLYLNSNDRVQLHLSQVSTGGLDNGGVEPGFYTSFSGSLIPDFIDYAEFSAAVTIDSADDPVVDTPLAFDDIDIISSYFDGTVYTAPNYGMYLFTFTAKGDQMAVHLKVNGNTKRSVMIDEYHSYEENSVSNSIVLLLNAGDQVALFHGGYGTDIDTASPSGGIFTQFSGVLLNLPASYVMNDAEVPVPQFAATAIGFSATRTIDMNDVSADTMIPFDLVDTNVGNAFDGVSTFTAPLKGFYLFTFAAKSPQVAVHLKVNDAIKRSAICFATHGNEFMTSNSAILSLEIGDTVNVHLSPFGVYGLVNSGATNGIYTSFNGVLLYESVVP